MNVEDTIAAIATPPGRGGIGVVRLSGPATRSIAEALLGKCPSPRVATVARFRAADGAPIDEGIALYFQTPRSYTGEDVLELHGHGGPVVLDMLLARVLELGARPARAGEFTERAFLNGKLDLAQAEAVADLIDAGSQVAVRAAQRSLDGEFSRRVQSLTEQLIQLRLHIEAAIDFPEEEIDFLADTKIAAGITTLENGLEELLAAAHQGQLLHDGMVVVLAGPPNVGKSSLLNALSATEAAIVSDVPGTTRDVLREFIQIDGMPLHVVDTAGLRNARDELEAEGMRRTHREMARADRLLVVDDDSDPRRDDTVALPWLPAGLPYTRLRNKIDLTGRAAAITERDGVTEIALSAKTGAGMRLLRQHLKACMGFQPTGEGTFSARRRHLDALRRVRAHLAAARAQVPARTGELLAEELRQAQQALSEITGAFTSDDLLGRIFASFCIGK